MMGHYATSAAPAWAIVTWVDDNFVYTQIPSTRGAAPFIQKYPLTSTGLGEALSLMREIYREQNPPGKGYDFLSRTRPATLIAPQQKGKKGKPLAGTQEQRDKAAAILRKMGIL